MTRARPLPPELQGRPFTVADAGRAGVGPSRLRAGDLVAPTRGVRAMRAAATVVPPDETPSQRMARLHDDLIHRAELFAPALTPRQFYSHDTGLALLEAPLPFTTARARELHVSARRPAGLPERKGVVGHRLPARAAATGAVRGLPVEHPARLWRQAGELWELDDLIAAGDFLVLPARRLLTIDDLRREVDTAGDVRGGLLRRALAEIRIGAESAQETRLRLAMRRAGLPEPVLQHELHDASGNFVARLDTAYPQYHVTAEYDGRHHAEEGQFARDADRWDAVRACGWQHIRVLSHHLHPDPQPAIDRIAVALFASGWRPGRP